MAIEIDKVNVQGYFIWSLLDNVEWGDGFRDTFGLYSVERPQCQYTTCHRITVTHSNGNGTTFAFGGSASTDAQLTTTGGRSCTSMSTSERFAIINMLDAKRARSTGLFWENRQMKGMQQQIDYFFKQR